MSTSADAAYFAANQALWDARVGAHLPSAFYDVAGFRAGATSLREIELAELIDEEVAGRTLLHLQCHFGQDTLAWARKGAIVTGLDFSSEAIRAARTLATELALPARFVEANVYDAAAAVGGEEFDVVFTSYGVIGWLPDLNRWATAIAACLKPGGTFYLAEFHPAVWMFDDDFKEVKYAYHNAGAIEEVEHGTYADRAAPLHHTYFGWNHGLGEVVSALLGAGLRLDFLHEFDFSPWNCFRHTVEVAPNRFQINGMEGKLPMVYSLRATKPRP
jgi:SAM-dependent methyltransferase